MADPRVERARLERVRKALVSPIYFMEQYIRPFDPNWTTAMPPHGQEMVVNALTHPRYVTVLPPEFGKTTWLSQALPVWLTVSWTIERRILRGMLLSEEENMARNNLRVISWHLTENERIKADFSDEAGRPLIRPSTSEDVWRDDAIVVQRIGASKDPTWQAKGLDSKGIHGRRLDWAIADDVITPAHGESVALRHRAQMKFDHELSTRLVKGGHIAVAGNFISPNDLLHDLGSRPGWMMAKRPSIHRPGRPDVAPKESELLDPENELLWETVWDRERLISLYREQPNNFRRIHLLDEKAEGGEKLQESWVRLIPESETPLEECEFFMGLDSAPGGEGVDLDFNVVTIGAAQGRRGSQHLDIIESYAVRTSPGQFASVVGILHDRWNRVGRGVKRIGIPRVSLDRAFGGTLDVVRPDLTEKVEGISTAGQKEERLEALGAFFQSGWARVWTGIWEQQTSAPKDVRHELTLKQEWVDFPHGNHDDRLDSLDVLIRATRLDLGDEEQEWVMEAVEV